jgi:hypothetical protein
MDWWVKVQGLLRTIFSFSFFYLTHLVSFSFKVYYYSPFKIIIKLIFFYPTKQDTFIFSFFFSAKELENFLIFYHLFLSSQFVLSTKHGVNLLNENLKYTKLSNARNKLLFF